MTKRRPTLEQQRAALQLGTLAAPYRFRVIADAEGFPIIPGRYGRIEWYCDGVNCWLCPLPRQVALAVYSDRPRLLQKLRAIPGVLRHQSGDAEMRAVFAVELLEQVATVIRAKRWGGAGLGRPENFALSPGQLATSPRSKPLPAEDQGWAGGTPRIPAGIVMISAVRTLPLIPRALMMVCGPNPCPREVTS